MAKSQSWLDSELAGSAFADERLGKRLRVLLEQMGGAVGESLPMACQDWAATMAAYRFFSNDRVSEAEVLAGHFQATRDRFIAHDGPVLVLQDTTEFTFQRESSEAIGFTTRVNSGKDKAGRTRVHTVCGLLMHASLVVTHDGLPLGLAAAKFWTRKKFKGTAELKKRINLTRVPIEEKESVRWLESMRQSTTLLGRSTRCVHIGDRESDIYELFCTAIEKLRWYAMRWKIETFHKILKSGCRTEEAKLRTAERLVNLIAVFCILSWRIFWLTMLNRDAPKAPAALVLTETESAVLDEITKRKGRAPPRRATVADSLVAIARFGGYLARANDPPPGNKVIWRGLSKLADITYGATLRLPRAVVGN